MRHFSPRASYRSDEKGVTYSQRRRLGSCRAGALRDAPLPSPQTVLSAILSKSPSSIGVSASVSFATPDRNGPSIQTATVGMETGAAVHQLVSGSKAVAVGSIESKSGCGEGGGGVPTVSVSTLGSSVTPKGRSANASLRLLQTPGVTSARISSVTPSEKVEGEESIVGILQSSVGETPDKRPGSLGKGENIFASDVSDEESHNRSVSVRREIHTGNMVESKKISDRKSENMFIGGSSLVAHTGAKLEQELSVITASVQDEISPSASSSSGGSGRRFGYRCSASPDQGLVGLSEGPSSTSRMCPPLSVSLQPRPSSSGADSISSALGGRGQSTPCERPPSPLRKRARPGSPSPSSLPPPLSPAGIESGSVPSSVPSLGTSCKGILSRSTSGCGSKAAADHSALKFEFHKRKPASVTSISCDGPAFLTSSNAEISNKMKKCSPLLEGHKSIDQGDVMLSHDESEPTAMGSAIIGVKAKEELTEFVMGIAANSDGMGVSAARNVTFSPVPSKSADADKVCAVTILFHVCPSFDINACI